MTELTNHLWQSTLFAAAVALAAWALRHNHARVRYALWLAASVKFLLPFALLADLGRQVDAPVAMPALTAVTVQQLTTSFAPATALPQAATPWWPALIWLTGSAFVALRWSRRWLAIQRAAGLAAPVAINAPIPVRASPSSVEPGVFGLFRPILLLPDGILEKLTSAELDAILAHELAHVQRHDNLTAAFHMLVESIFWFHPLVWWIGAKLVEERERACDEAVLRAGSEPQVYAQSILNVCKHYVGSPLPCAAGVTGADLKQRIQEIMRLRLSRELTTTAKLALAGFAIAAVALPLSIGVLIAQTLPPPPTHKFEVATIRPGDPSSRQVRIAPGPQGGIRTENTTVLSLLTFAYDLRDFQFVGGPGWIRTDPFNIAGTPDTPEALPTPGMPREKTETQFNRQRQRMQSLLLERFHLVLRAETREMPLYELSIGKNGHKLTAATAVGKGPSMRMNRGQLTGAGVDLKMLTNSLSNAVGRPVVDATGLKGAFNCKLEWTPDTASPDAPGPSLFTALQEQLGLKLEARKGPAPVLVIEKIEKPSEN